MQEQTKEEVKPIKGKITKLNKEKGWGFIISNEMKFVKFFFHWTALAQGTRQFTDLEPGMKCEFIPIDLVNDPLNPTRGPKAIKIRIIE